MPAVSEEKAQVDIEQAIAEGRAEKARKRSKLAPDERLLDTTSISVQLSYFRCLINRFKGTGILTIQSLYPILLDSSPVQI